MNALQREHNGILLQYSHESTEFYDFLKACMEVEL